MCIYYIQRIYFECVLFDSHNHDTATQPYPNMCVKMGRSWVLFGPQVSEMSEMISLKMGVKFAILLNIG